MFFVALLFSLESLNCSCLDISKERWFIGYNPVSRARGALAPSDLLLRREQKRFMGEAPMYFEYGIESGADNYLVWNRATNGKNDDPSILAIGYENIVTEWGDEGSKIYHDTVGSTRMIFFSGGMHSEKRISQQQYNHIYEDFYELPEKVPYMLNSAFFDYIIVGVDTFCYMTRKSIVTNFITMLSKNGVMFLPLTFRDNFFVPISKIFSDCSVSFYSQYNTTDESKLIIAKSKATHPFMDYYFSNEFRKPEGYAIIRK